MSKRVTWMLAVCAIGGGGCVDLDGDTGPAGEAGDGAVFQRTVVRLEADGTQTVHTDRVTAEQQRWEIAARQALADGHPPPPAPEAGLGTTSAAISVDGSCVGASMWMFDQPNITRGNEICFTGCGEVDLSQYLRPICGPSFCFLLYWDGATRSFWAGNDHGWFESTSNTEHFTPYQLQNAVDAIVSGSRWLRLCDWPLPN